MGAVTTRWRRGLIAGAFLGGAAVALLGQVVLTGSPAFAQKAQTEFKDKLHWGTETAGVGVACSADGQHVFVAGPEGILVSDNFGKTGTWSLVVKGK
jgi:hypothetical protein